MAAIGQAIAFLLGMLVIAGPPAHAADGSLDVPVKDSEAADAPVTEKLHLYSASKALVVGNDHYGGAGWFGTGGGWPKLSKGIEDADAVAKSLEAKGFKVTLLKDLGADALKSAMEDFFIREGADPEARLLIWFAGHGHTIGGEGYLVPVDAPNPNKDEIEFRRKALSLRRFGEFMRGANAKHVLAVFDSCFAGTIFDVARALPPRAITRATALKVRQFVSSGDADQTVSDNGRFRRLFLDALDGKEPNADPNGDGFITGTELGLFLSDKITNLSEKGQTPRYGKLIAEGYDRGDFVLEKARLDGAIVPASPNPSPGTAAGAAADKGAVSSSGADPAAAERAWSLVKDQASVAAIEAFQTEFGKASPFYNQLASDRIAALKDETAKKEAAERAAKDEEAKAATERQRREKEAAGARAKGEARKKAEIEAVQKAEADRQAPAVEQPPAEQRRPLPASARVCVVTMIGAPEGVHNTVDRALRAGLNRRGFNVIAGETCEREQFTIRGYLVAADDPPSGVTKYSTIFDITDGAGNRIRRYTGLYFGRPATQKSEPWSSPDVEDVAVKIGDRVAGYVANGQN